MHILKRSALAASSALSGPIYTADEMFTYDQATIDSSGEFLVGELERLDSEPYRPLVSVTWSRDIDLREDITAADESASWLNLNYAAPGGLRANGKNWISRESTAISGPAVEYGRTIQPLNIWGMQLSWTMPELQTAAALRRPVDRDKYDALQLKYEMDTDEQVYAGDTDYGTYGLTNSPAVTPMSVSTGANGNTTWATKQPTEILTDINTLLESVWTATAFAFTPTHLLLPPLAFSRLVSTLISTAGNQSVLKFVSENSLANQNNGAPLIIAATKWLAGRGGGGTDRIVAYRKDRQVVAFPRTMLQRTPVEYSGLWQKTSYWGRMGSVEFHRPEAVGYMDGV